MRRKTIILSLISTLIIFNFLGCTSSEVSEENNKVNETNDESSGEDEIEEVEEEEASEEDEETNSVYLFAGDDELAEEEIELFYGEESLKDRISNYLGDEINNMGLLYYNLSTGEQISFNEEQVFYAASLYKLGMNIICYDMADKGEISLQDTITVERYADEADNEYLDYSAYTEPTTIQELLDQTIINSDNTAACMIYHYLGGWNAFRSQYISFFQFENEIWTNDTTVNNEFTILKYLYDFRENELYTHLIETMKNSFFHDRIDKYIPQELVAHKIGNLDETVNDEGIVFTDEPYIIIFLSDGVGYAAETIANISKAFYIYNVKNTSSN